MEKYSRKIVEFVRRIFWKKKCFLVLEKEKKFNYFSSTDIAYYDIFNKRKFLANRKILLFFLSRGFPDFSS